MTLSFTEELVSEYYKHILDNKGRPKYLVSDHIHYQLPKAGVNVKGWHDIDVLAIAQNEILIIQTKQYSIFENTKAESMKSLQEFYQDAEHVVRQSYDVKNKQIKKVFIAEDMSKNMKVEIANKGIEAEWFGEIIRKYMQCLYDKYEEAEKLTIGKEENNLTRVLLSLVMYFEKELMKAEILHPKQQP